MSNKRRRIERDDYTLSTYNREKLDETLLKTELFIEVGSRNEIDLIVEKIPSEVKRMNTRKLGNFESLMHGNYICAGNVGKHPVTVSFHYVRFNNHIVTFYYGTSQLVYYPLIEDWIKHHFPTVRRTDNYFSMYDFCLPLETKKNSKKSPCPHCGFGSENHCPCDVI